MKILIAFTSLLLLLLSGCKENVIATSPNDPVIPRGDPRDRIVVTADRSQEILDSVTNANGWSNEDSIKRMDSLTRMLSKDLIANDWMTSDDYLFVDSFDLATKTYYLTHGQEQDGNIKSVHKWQYLVGEAIIDPTKDRKEINLSLSGITSADRKKLKSYDPFRK